MQTIQFFNSASSGSATLTAGKPVVYQAFKTIAIGEGATAVEIIGATEIPVDTCAAYGGQLVNSGCYDLKATLTYVVGGDCSSPGCAGSAADYVTETVDIIVPKNSVFPLPDGFFQKLEVLTIDADQAPIAATSEVKVSLHSSYTPGCGGCVKAIA
jgi:hypothetical protein